MGVVTKFIRGSRDDVKKWVENWKLQNPDKRVTSASTDGNGNYYTIELHWEPRKPVKTSLDSVYSKT